MEDTQGDDSVLQNGLKRNSVGNLTNRSNSRQWNWLAAIIPFLELAIPQS